MDNYLQSMQFSAINSRYHHPQHGALYPNQEPLQSVIAQCDAQVFSGTSFTFGSQTIADPKVLTQIYLDSIDHKLKSIRMFKTKKLRESDQAKYRAFEHADKYQPQLDALYKLIAAKHQCLKDNGWSL
jgi:hypothetical protein